MPGKENNDSKGHVPKKPVIGILMLDTKFPRILGDIGNAETWPFEVCYGVVKGADVDLVVRGGAKGLLAPFIAEAKKLIAEGASGIATGCGFLSIYQKELAEELSVPIVTSSLLQAASIKMMLPKEKCVGIITISEEDLSENHLRMAGVPEGTPIVGTDKDTEISRVIFNDEATLDIEAARKDLENAATKLVGENPNVGAILLECTNMAPYAPAINMVTGLPVYSIYSLLNWFYASLTPQKFD